MHSHSFNRRGGPRKALIKGLIISMIEHERITTTITKAKELQRHVEHVITLGRNNDLSTRRLLISRIGCEKTVAKVLSTLSPRFKARPGGYTRVLKMGLRPGDMAPMAMIEFVDYKLPEETKKSDTLVKGAAADAKAKAKKNAAAREAKRKNVRKMKANSRRANRGKSSK
jgi:large subunit ribosomal protein L17